MNKQFPTQLRAKAAPQEHMRASPRATKVSPATLAVASNPRSNPNDTLDGEQMAFMDHGKEKKPLQIHRDDLLEKLRLKDEELYYLHKKLNTSFGQTKSQSKTENLKLKLTLENILSTLNEEQNHLKRLRKDHERTLNLEVERCNELLDLIQKNSIPPTNLKHLYMVTTNLILESYGVYIKQGITMTSIDFISLWKNLTLY